MTITATGRLTGTRVVVVSSEQPGSRMAGPAIRATSLARELAAAGADVVLACPARPDVDLGLDVVAFGKPDPAGFRRLARGCDIVVTQPQRVDVAAGLHRGTARVIYDWYVPSFVEYPASVLAGGRADRTKAKLIERNHRENATAVECGDGFLVASQRQKDFLLGALGQSGRLQSPADANAESHPRVVVVPFGLSEERPARPQTHPIKGSLVPEDAFVALWAGGVWNWFDPLTVVRGARLAREQVGHLRLVFLASGHPSAAFEGQDAAAAALDSPEVTQAIDAGTVVFADRWVPFADRWDYLRDADLGVCAFFDSPETRMSFRTRYLDHLWSGLPTVTTSGGVLSDLMCSRGAARCLPERDPDAWAAAFVELADAPDERAEMSAAADNLSREFRWNEVAGPVVELIEDIRSGAVGPRRAPGLSRVAPYLAVALENRFR